MIILDLPMSANGDRNYAVGRVRVLVADCGTVLGGRTRVTCSGSTRVLEGSWLSDTAAIEAFHKAYPLF